MAPVSQDPEAVLDWAARWTLALSEVGGGIDERRRFIEYLAAIQDGALINQFEEASGRHGLNLEKDIMSYAQQLLDEGRAEGRIQERIQVVQGFVETGTSWDIIQSATGLTEACQRHDKKSHFRHDKVSHFLRVKGLPSGWLPRRSLAILLLRWRTEHARLALALEPVALALDVDGRRVV